MFHKISRCIVCGNKNFKFIQDIFSDAFDAKIFRCVTCGLFFQNPMPDEKFLADFYNNIYKKQYSFSSTEKAFEEKDEQQERQRIAAMEQFVTKGKILDVGASTGFFLSELKKKKSWEVFGVEYSDVAVRKAKKMYGLDIVHGDIHHKKLPENFYDVVTMHSVLEHIPDIDKTVGEVRKRLKKGGYFIFNVPNLRSFEYTLYKVLGRKFPGFIVEHIYYFTPHVLRILLRKHGFLIQSMTSRHYSTLHMPPKRPMLGWVTFLPKLFLEYTDPGGKLQLGNILYVYAQKID